MVLVSPGTTAVVLDSPHSGVDYPPDFGFSCDAEVLRRAEDTHVEKLYDFAGRLGAAWIEATFPRSYLDVNRDLTEIDVSLFGTPWPGAVATDPKMLDKIRLGKGLVWRTTDEGVPLYARKLAVAEVQRRIERCWQPYHAAVGAAIAGAHARHGYSIHINCHSMPAEASAFATLFPGERHPDFVVGDRDGTTAAAALSRIVVTHLEQLGYTVGYNHPYKGVELVRRHSAPGEHRHSIQLEVNRKLYMDEQSLAIHAGFIHLQQSLESLVACLTEVDPR